LFFLPLAALGGVRMFLVGAPLAQQGRLSAVLLMALIASFAAYAMRWRESNVTYVDLAVLVALAAALGWTLTVPSAAVFFAMYRRWFFSAIYLALFLIATIPPLFGLQPFVYQYAGAHAAKPGESGPAVADLLRLSHRMSLVWGFLFAGSLAASISANETVRHWLPCLLICGVGLPFNFVFPRYYFQKGSRS
jgi:hypothetical protein